MILLSAFSIFPPNVSAHFPANTSQPTLASRAQLSEQVGQVQPRKAWAGLKTWGGTGNDFGQGVTVDTFGDTYVTGYTNSFGGAGDHLVILKYTDAGALQWQKTWGGTGNEYGRGVAVDYSGNIYVTGSTTSFGAGSFDLVLLKFDSSGNLIWQKTWGGSDSDEGYGVAIDSSSGSIYVTGYTNSFGTGHQSVILLKFDPSGSLLWQRTWGGNGIDGGEGVAVDSSGNVYVTGFSGSATASGDHDIVLLKFDPSGSLLWQTTWGGISLEEGYGMALGPSGNIYVTGVTESFGPGLDAVVLLKFDPSSNLLWQRTWGGDNVEAGYGVAVSFTGNVYVTGHTYSFGGRSGWGDSVILLGFDSSGGLMWQRSWSGNNHDTGNGVAVDSHGNAVVTGFVGEGPPYAVSSVGGMLVTPTVSQGKPSFQAGVPSIATKTPSFSLGTPTGGENYHGGEDILLFKLGPDQATWGGHGDENGSGVTTDSQGNIYVTGTTKTCSPDIPREICHPVILVLLKYDKDLRLVWQRTWNGTDITRIPDTWGNSVTLDSSGNIYVTGGTAFDDAYPPDLYVVLLKYDSSGNLLWQRTWGGNSPDSSQGNAVAVDSSGNVYVAGDWTQKQHSYDVCCFYALLLKYDSSGNLKWQRNWGSSSNFTRGEGVSLDSSGNAYVTGYTTLIPTGGAADVILLEYDSSGNLKWQRNWRGDYYAAVTVHLSSGSIYVVTGTVLGPPPYNGAILLLKFDSIGNVQWNKTLAKGQGNAVSTDTAGNIYITDGNVLLKTDSTGNVLWQKTFGGSGGDEGRGLAFDSSGNLVVAGSTSSFGAGASDVLLLRYGLASLVEYQITFQPTANAGFITFSGRSYADGDSDTYAAGGYPAIAIPAQGYVFTGWTSSGSITVADPGASSTTVAITGTGSLKASFSHIRPTNTAISCDSPGTIGSPSSCIATVADTGANPTTPSGIVAFSSTGAGGSFSPTTCALAGGSCSVNFTPTASGTTTVTGSYGGDSTHASSSGTATIVVVSIPSAPQNPSATGQVGQILLQWQPPSSDGGSPIIAYRLYRGTSSGDLHLLHNAITATYFVDTSVDCQVTYYYRVSAFNAYGEGPQSAELNAKAVCVPHPTQITVTCTPSTIDLRQTTSCTATVTDSNAYPTTPTGTVSFTSSGAGSFTPAASCTLESGSCSITYAPTTIGTGSHSIEASYGGDSSHSTSGPKSTIVTVTKRTVALSVMCSPASVVINQGTTCTATVTDNGQGGSPMTPSGSVRFAGKGDFSPANCTLSGGGASANCSVSYTPRTVGTGTETISASVDGDVNHISTSGTFNLTVQPAPFPWVLLGGLIGIVVTAGVIGTYVYRRTTGTGRVNS